MVVCTFTPSVHADMRALRLSLALIFLIVPPQALHLGTNAIKLPNNRYAAILHGITASSSRTYLNFMYVFEGRHPWRIVGVGADPLQLPLGSVGSGFAFTTNLAWLGDKIVVSYCVKDRTSSFFVANATTLLSNIQAV